MTANHSSWAKAELRSDEVGLDSSGLDAAREQPPRAMPRRLSAATLAGSLAGLSELTSTLEHMLDAAVGAPRPSGPLPSGKPIAVLKAVTLALGAKEIPERGVGSERALGHLARLMVEYGLDLSHPRAAAHLHPPPLAVAVAADALASIGNASLDTYDSGPATLAIERWLIAALARLAKLGPNADGVLTPGGSLSNLLGLLLARDAAAQRRGIDVRRQGVRALSQPVVFCSELAHFSIHRACAALGLGETAVRTIPTDDAGRLRPKLLAQMLSDLSTDHTLLAVVATAGTTDSGSVDPLPEIAALCREHGTWLHIDAAYGFGMLFSERLAPRLAGIELAHSITLDLHKLGWQPAAASVLMVSDTAAFSALDREVAYLNPCDDSAAGYDGLLGHSLQTTRRPDAVKIVATLLAHGRRGLGEMVDTCHDLARHAQQRIESEPELQLLRPAELTTVVFRYRGAKRRATPGSVADVARENAHNAELRRRMLENGIALVGRTSLQLNGPEAPPLVCLKLTLLNPTATVEDIDGLLDAVLRVGRSCARQFEESAA